MEIAARGKINRASVAMSLDYQSRGIEVPVNVQSLSLFNDFTNPSRFKSAVFNLSVDNLSCLSGSAIYFF